MAETYSSGVAFAIKVSSMRFLHNLKLMSGHIYILRSTHTWPNTGCASAQILDTSGAGDITVLLSCNARRLFDAKAIALAANLYTQHACLSVRYHMGASRGRTTHERHHLLIPRKGSGKFLRTRLISGLDAMIAIPSHSRSRPTVVKG